MHKIAEYQNVDFETFHHQVVAANQPAVLRALVRDWPAVIRGGSSADSVCAYLQELDSGNPVYTIAAPASAGGRFFYNDDLQSFNFNRGEIPLAQVLAQLLEGGDVPGAHAIAVQALSIRDTLPGFEDENSIGLLHNSVAPTMWISNRGQVAPHYDVHRNLACVVAGRRKFTLFPPEQIGNLYLGPILNAPGGVPISLVDVENPDFEAFPRYAEALEAAQETILEPGDAIYIPSLWWHGVRSLEKINLLVNYWWGGDTQQGLSPNDTLIHGMLAIAALDESQRLAWREYFDHYVFRVGEDPAAHLPSNLTDIVTSLGPQQIQALKDRLAQRLK